MTSNKPKAPIKSPVNTIQKQIKAEKLLEATLVRINTNTMDFTITYLNNTDLFLTTLILIIHNNKNIKTHLKLLNNYF